MRAASAAASISSSVASGLAKRRFSRTEAWKRYVSCETTPTRSLSACEAQVADVDAVDRDLPAADVVEPRRQVAERRLAGAGLADERRRRPVRDRERDVLQRPVLAVAEPDVVEDDVAGLRHRDRVRLLLDVDRLVEVLEDAVEERERGLHVEADAEQRADREEEPRLQRRERDEHRDRDRRASRAPARGRRTSRPPPA